MAEVAEDIWVSIGEYVGAEGLELYDLEVAGGRGEPSLRVVVDGPEGVNLDHLADLSRGIDRLLVDTRYDTTKYGLELTSPGLERKLRRPEHWASAVGSKVTVKTRPEIDGSRRHEGELVSADESSAQVKVEEGLRTIPFADVTSARIVFVWQKGVKPGKKE